MSRSGCLYGGCGCGKEIGGCCILGCRSWGRGRGLEKCSMGSVK